jgi:hypothetical protein
MKTQHKGPTVKALTKILENCTERKSEACKKPSKKMYKLSRTSFFKINNLKTQECRKKLFTGLYLYCMEVQIQ